MVIGQRLRSLYGEFIDGIQQPWEQRDHGWQRGTADESTNHGHVLRKRLTKSR